MLSTETVNISKETISVLAGVTLASTVTPAVTGLAAGNNSALKEGAAGKIINHSGKSPSGLTSADAVEYERPSTALATPTAFRCELCDLYFPSEVKLERHNTFSTIHLLKVQQANEAGTPTPVPSSSSDDVATKLAARKMLAELIFEGDNHDWRSDMPLFHKIYEIVDADVFLITTTHHGEEKDEDFNNIYASKAAVLAILSHEGEGSGSITTTTKGGSITSTKSFAFGTSFSTSSKKLSKSGSLSSSLATPTSTDELSERVELQLKRKEYSKVLKNRIQVDPKLRKVFLTRNSTDPDAVTIELADYNPPAPLELVERAMVGGRGKRLGSRRSSVQEFYTIEQGLQSNIKDVSAAVLETNKQLEMMRGIMGVWTDTKGRAQTRHTMASLPQSRLQAAAVKVATKNAVNSTRAHLDRSQSRSEDVSASPPAAAPPLVIQSPAAKVNNLFPQDAHNNTVSPAKPSPRKLAPLS